tara:strand:- start:6381 stop:6605 length:225 start_codon:yes stop_codon:yes gene_type:complete
MQLTTEIEYNEVSLIVVGYYQEGEASNYEHPGSPSEFIIEEVYTETDGSNIFSILNFATLDDIEILCLSNIEDQ